MPTKGITGFDPSALYQVGIVVKSIDETVKFYTEVFGIGPFEIIEKDFPNATYYGKKAGYRGKRAFAQLGPLTLELIELVEGKTVHEDFLKEKGEGIHHLGFAVKDLKKCEEEAEKTRTEGCSGDQKRRRERFCLPGFRPDWRGDV